jgi:cytochrome P450
MAQPIDIDTSSQAFKANPYPTYAQIRAIDPVHRVSSTEDGRSIWLITSYEEAEAALRDPRLIKRGRDVIPPEMSILQRIPNVAVYEQISSHMLSTDPPDHTRLRGLVNKAFTPHLVEQWRGRIQAITDESLDAVQDKGKMELINDFAFPLPMTVISEMLGIPVDDRQKFRYWSNLLVTGIGDTPTFIKNFPMMEDFASYIYQLASTRRSQPQDDLITKLVQAEAEGVKLSQNELVSMIFLLIIAGHETTVNLIGNGVLALLQHPEQAQLLRQDPTLIRSAIEELLRYNGPLFNATARWAREDLEIGGKQIRRGDMISVELASANHDERQFFQADELDITRQENRHIAFGKGIHYCLGAPLARLEGQIAIGTLLRRLPNLRLDIDPRNLTWRPGTLVHALDMLPVAF